MLSRLFNGQGTQCSDLLGKAGSHFGKLCPFCGRDPFQSDSPWIYTKQIHKLLGGTENFLAFDITLQVMAVTDVSAGYKDTIRAVLKAFEDEVRVDPA